jgi:membrane-bound metal-dependent hydrolase YbcI (DUF457 family)
MFAVGHMALAYLLGKISAQRLKISVIVPAILVLSIIPDIDILFGMDQFHRGPTHSAVVAFLVFVPLFVVYRKRAAPYFLALLSHGLIGDLLIGGKIQLFWPISTDQISLTPWLPKIPINSPINVALELSLFILATIVMFRTKDLRQFFRNNKSNLLLVIPIFTVLLPTVLAYPLQVPIYLVPPHIFYLALFTVAILAVFLGFFNKSKTDPAKSNPSPSTL